MFFSGLGQGDWVRDENGLPPWAQGSDRIKKTSVSLAGTKDVGNMFYGCSNLKNANLCGFDMSQVESADAMFTGCKELELIYTPVNLSCMVDLPTNIETDIWYRSDGTAEKNLPQNYNYSIALGKNYTPEEIPRSITECTGGSIIGSVGVKLDVAKKGDTFTLNGYNYIITKVASTVSFTGIKGSKTTLTIPATVKYDGKTYKVTEVSSAALKNNKNVKTIKLGSNIKTISSYAFSFCAKLEKVTIGSGVKTIGKGAFNGCKKLKSVAIGKNVTKIEASAFYKCKALTKTTIPGKVTSIGNAAFDGCSKLKTITIKSDKLKKIGKNAFVRIKKGASIKVPKSKYLKLPTSINA